MNDDEMIIRTVASIRKEFPDVAITLSLGEKETSVYERFSRLELTDIYFVTKRIMSFIIASFTLKLCHCPTV